MDIEISPEELFHNGAVPADRLSSVSAEWARDSRVGGVVSFIGVVRADETAEGIVEAIEFSAYEEMARQETPEMVARIAREIGESAPPDTAPSVLKIHVEHALGTVSVGEIAVLIVAAAGHRPEAFTFCREVLEQLKKEIPIYGKEIFRGEGHRWKQNR